MRVQPTADTSLKGISVPARPGLADCIGTRGPGALTVAMHGIFSDLLSDENALHETPACFVGNARLPLAYSTFQRRNAFGEPVDRAPDITAARRPTVRSLLGWSAPYERALALPSHDQPFGLQDAIGALLSHSSPRSPCP